MRVSKLEPHVLGAPPAEELDSVLDELTEESKSVEGTDNTAQNDSIDSFEDSGLKDTIVRLSDYLKKRQGQKKTRLAIALSRYIYQRDQIINAESNKSLKP